MGNRFLCPFPPISVSTCPHLANYEDRKNVLTFPASVQACFDFVEGNHGSGLCDSHPKLWAAAFLVLFPDLQKHECLPASRRDLNKSWLPWCLSSAVPQSGSWRPLNCSTQNDGCLLIHSFFWKERLISMPISTPTPHPPLRRPSQHHPTRSCQAVRVSAAASQAHQIKGVCLWHFEGSSPPKKA